MSTVCVITPTWQRNPKVVARAVGSLRAQTMQDWQQVVASDGAQEAGIAMLCEDEAKAGNAKLRYLVTGKHHGDYGYGVRNEVLFGLSGTSEYVCFLDDDNVLLPTYLEKMVRALNERPDACMAVCRCLHFGPLPSGWGRPPCVLTGFPVEVGSVDLVQAVVRRAALMQLGGFQPYGTKNYLADGHTFALLAHRGPVVQVDELLALHL